MAGKAPQLTDIFTYLAHLLQALVPLTGFLAFIMILVGGFKFLTAGSNAENLEKAKKTLTFAIIGLALVILSWLTIKVIAYLTGAHILELQTTFSK